MAPFWGDGSVMWNLISFAILWLVWLKRNARLFKRALITKEDVAQLVLMRMWASSRDNFGSSRADSIL